MAFLAQKASAQIIPNVGGGGGNVVPVVSVSASPSPAIYGSTVTISLTVSPSSCGASVNLTVTDNGTQIGFVGMNGSGQGTLTTSSLAVGSNVIEASYAGGKIVGSETCVAATGNTTLTVSKGTPTITWGTPSPITYGTALSGTQLNATANVAGTFAYSPAAGTVLQAGSNTLATTFTPTSTTDYNTASDSVSLTVSKAGASLTWPTPSAITYGTALSGTQLDASSNVAGSYSYSPAAGTVLAAGTQTLSAAFTPTNTTDYNTGTVTTSIVVSKATPAITWRAPSAIVYGTAISSTQLDASASVSGTFSYSPAAGTVPAAGTQTLSATFTPSDTSDYNTATASVSLLVLSSAPTITGLSPAIGLPGTSVVISGSNFGSTQGAVTFDSTTATVTNWSASSITAIVPAGSTTGNVVVSIDGYDSNGVSFTVEELVPGTVYSYSVPSGGYDADGNLSSYADSGMGTWTLTYDYLNRLSGGTASPATFDGGYFCWSYDSFGNRTGQTGASVAFSAGSPQCQPGSGASTITSWGHYNANNQLTGTNQGVPTYDAAGNITYDGNYNHYLYDGEGRICAVHNTAAGTMTQYIYDADGNRVSKGAITTFSCDSTSNGFSASVSTTSNYVLDLSGQELTEVDGTGAWQHTNLFATGMLVATYDKQGLHYHLSDPLGTRRAQTDSNGVVETGETYISLPYGEMPVGQALGATEHHFTGKEHDQESGNDDFGARYYASSMGRFLSPDWSAKEDPVPYAKLDDPQSLNLYSYVRNNPLSRVDADGHCAEDACVVEGTVAAGIVLYGAAIATRAYLETPSGQRSLETFTSAASASISSSVQSIKNTATNWFSKKSAPAQAKSGEQSKAKTDGRGPRKPNAKTKEAADKAATGEDGKQHCTYCGQELTNEPGKPNSKEYDHETPWSQNGDSSPENIKDACRTCNRKKGGRTPDQWRGANAVPKDQ